jgi:hypothetical protein
LTPPRNYSPSRFVLHALYHTAGQRSKRSHHGVRCDRRAVEQPGDGPRRHGIPPTISHTGGLRYRLPNRVPPRQLRYVTMSRRLCQFKRCPTAVIDSVQVGSAGKKQFRDRPVTESDCDSSIISTRIASSRFFALSILRLMRLRRADTSFPGSAGASPSQSSRMRLRRSALPYS